MKSRTIFIFSMIIFLTGCSGGGQVLNDFQNDSLQEIKNNGITLQVPSNWDVSVKEDLDGKSVTINREEVVLSVLGYESGEELDLEGFCESYQELMYEDGSDIAYVRDEIMSSQDMKVIDYSDVVNGVATHGTVYLFVVDEWYYVISFTTNEQISYAQELAHIMNTFSYDKPDEKIVQDDEDASENTSEVTVEDEEYMQTNNLDEFEEDISQIDVSYVVDKTEETNVVLKVYIKNNSQSIFTGTVHVFFYSSDGNKNLGSDAVIVEELMPGQESWSNVIIDKYEGMIKMENEFSDILFTDLELISGEVNSEISEKLSNSVKLNFEGTSWYDDIQSIQVYDGGICVVVSKSLDDNTVIANAILSCGTQYGISSVNVTDENGNILVILNE